MTISAPFLAVDPGNKESAYVWFVGGQPTPERGIVPNEDMLSMILNDASRCIDDRGVLAIEMVESFGMAVGKEVFETVWWIGRFCQAWGNHKWVRIYRKQVKMTLCQSMRAKDANIRQALIDIFGGTPSIKKDGILHGISKDVWSALAVGVTYLKTQEKQ